MEELTKVDYEDIEFLLRIGNMIQEDYHQLYQLENVGKKDSKEYQNAFSHLRSSIELEENTFSRLSGSYEKGIAITKILAERSKCDFSKESLDFHMDKDKQIFFRYIVKFSLNSLQDKEGMKKKMFAHVEETPIDELGIEDKILQYSTLPVYFSMMLSNDVINLVMAINENRKRNIKSEEIKEEMSRIKYLFSFVFNEIEKEMLTNNFEINLSPYLISDSLQSVYNIPKELFRKMKSTLCHQNALGQLEEMFHYSDYELIDPKNMCNLMISQSYIRAFLVMMEEEDKVQLKEEIDDILNYLSHINGIPFRIAQNMLEETFSLVEEDKKIPKIITIRLK